LRVAGPAHRRRPEREALHQTVAAVAGVVHGVLLRPLTQVRRRRLAGERRQLRRHSAAHLREQASAFSKTLAPKQQPPPFPNSKSNSKQRI